MSERTTIEWTDATFNPWWGCTKVSPGCDHCYAERDARRFGTQWGPDAERREFGESHWLKPIEWDRRAAKAGKPTRVFCASMADVFDKDAPSGAREMLWETIERTPNLRWQLLTKRIGNVARMVPEAWMRNGFPSHVWLGISVVNQEEADRDIPKLLAVPAAIRFLSCEPLLGKLDITPYLFGREDNGVAPGRPVGTCVGYTPPLDWVIAGGESGPHARPAHPDWFRSLRDQCEAADVPYLFKQWGEHLHFHVGSPNVTPHRVAVDGVDYPVRGLQPCAGGWFVRVGKKAAGRLLDGITHDGFPTEDGARGEG